MEDLGVESRDPRPHDVDAGVGDQPRKVDPGQRFGQDGRQSGRDAPGDARSVEDPRDFCDAAAGCGEQTAVEILRNRRLQLQLADADGH